MTYISEQTGLSYDFDQLARRADPRDEEVFWHGSTIDNDAKFAYEGWLRNRTAAEKYNFLSVYYGGGEPADGAAYLAYGAYVYRQRCHAIFGIEPETVKELLVQERIALYQRNGIEVHEVVSKYHHLERTSPAGFIEKIDDNSYEGIRGTKILIGCPNRGWNYVWRKSDDKFHVVDAEAYTLMPQM